MSVNNGSRIDVVLPDFKGVAGFTRTDDKASLAYIPQGGAALAPGATIELEGATWRVLEAGRDVYYSAMMVLSLALA